MNDLRFTVVGLPPAKGEALSMVGARHAHRSRVVDLLTAARDAIAASCFGPFRAGEPIGLDVIVRCADGQAWDATNYLGGIGDVLQSQRVGANVAHLGELADVFVYPNDRQIGEIHYRLVSDTMPSYSVRLWSLDRSPGEASGTEGHT